MAETLFLKKARRYLLAFIGAAFALALWLSPDNTRRAKPDEIRYATPDATVLFFRNLRAKDYDLEENNEAKLWLYRHKRRELDTSKTALNLLLVLDWRNNRGYLRPEPTSSAFGEDKSLCVLVKKETAQDTLRLRPNARVPEEYAFIAQLYNALLEESDFFILTESKKLQPILHQRYPREAFRLTVLDYLRLVQHIR